MKIEETSDVPQISPCEPESRKRGRQLFFKYKKLIAFLCAIVKLMPKSFIKRRLEAHRYTLGKFGMGIRYALVKALAQKCGDNVAIYPGVYILNPEYLMVGNNVSIQPMAYLECGKSNEDCLQIDDDVSIAHGVTIMTTSHVYDQLDVPIKDILSTCKKVHICNNVWIGAKATILQGRTLASGCIIGANAVVTKDTEPNKIYAGVPARLIKSR